MQTADSAPGTRLTPIQWLICAIAAIGFAFDIYEILMLPLIVRPALLELTGAVPGSPAFQMWVGLLFYIPAFAGGIFGLLGGYMTDRFGRRRVLTYSILIYAISAFLSGLRHLDRHAALPALPRLHRRVRRVRGGGGVAGRALPRPKRREKVLGYTQAFSSLGGLLVATVNSFCVALRGGAAGARCVRLGSHPESPRAVALHADVRRHPGDPADPHPAVPARIAGLAPAEGGGHAAPPEHRRAVLAGAASHDDRHDRDVRHGLRRGVRRHPADPADRARTARK